MDTGCSIPLGRSVREKLQACFIQQFRHSFWVQTSFMLSEQHELKNPVLKKESISYKQL